METISRKGAGFGRWHDMRSPTFNNYWNKFLEWVGSFFALPLGVFLLYHGVEVNRRHWLLKHDGHRTWGVLENVTRTRHRVNFIPTGSTYAADVSFHDDAGNSCTIHSDVNDEFLEKYKIGDETFTHLPVEVAFLPDDPKVSEFPEMMGVTVWPFILGGVFSFFGGRFVWKGLRGTWIWVGRLRPHTMFGSVRDSFEDILRWPGELVDHFRATWRRIVDGRREARTSSPSSSPDSRHEAKTIWMSERRLGTVQTLRHRGQKIQYRVPPGIDRNITLRFKGIGRTRKQEPADFLLRIEIDRGQNLEAALWLTQSQASTGAQKRLRLRKKTLTVQVPPSSVDGQVLRLQGMGQKSRYRFGLLLFGRKRGELWVTLHVFPDRVFPNYRSADQLEVEELALEGWIYRRSDEIMRILPKSPLTVPPFTATKVCDIFGENGWEAVGWALVEHLGLESEPIFFWSSNSQSVPGHCETKITNGRAGRYNITIASAYLGSPFAVVAILAHELCHVIEMRHLRRGSLSEKLLGQKLLEMERTVDLLVYLYSLGEFQLRFASQSRVTLGYFNQDCFERLYTLASRKRNPEST